MTFYETQFPTDISYGSSGGPKRLTQVVTMRSGFEERNQLWAHSLRTYDAGLGIRRINHLAQVFDFWESVRGRLHGFRWKDWVDYKSCPPTTNVAPTDQILGIGDGVMGTGTTEFQLVKRYGTGDAEYARPIRKPVTGTVVIALDDVPQPTGWTVDTTTGVVTFDDAPDDGVTVTAGYEFDVPVRFTDDELSASVEGFEAGAVQTVGITEIRV